MHKLIQDKVAFKECIQTLSRGKTPGPDGIANELIQALPPVAKQAVHNMIQIMWATGCTPGKWKESDTILLYKNKGTPLDLKYYRRIGLENTLYKVWTRMVTYAMADYAERNKMISNSQAGYRAKRSTVEQLELLTLLREDAQMYKQDLYLLQLDCSEAFDTVDHDKLLMILYDMGLPTDAVAGGD